MKVYKMILNIATTNLQINGTTTPTSIPEINPNKIEWKFKFPVSIESITIDLSDHLTDLSTHSIKCYYRLDEEYLGIVSKNKAKAIRFDDITDTVPLSSESTDCYTDITEFIINSGGIAKLIPKNNIPISCKVFGFLIEGSS